MEAEVAKQVPAVGDDTVGYTASLEFVFTGYAVKLTLQDGAIVPRHTPRSTIECLKPPSRTKTSLSLTRLSLGVAKASTRQLRSACARSTLSRSAM